MNLVKGESNFSKELRVLNTVSTTSCTICSIVVVLFVDRKTQSEMLLLGSLAME